MKVALKYVGLHVFGALLVVCAVLTVIYGKAQSDLTLEGNWLYSADAVVAKGNFAQIAQTLDSAGVNYVAYREIDDPRPIRALYEPNGTVHSLPLHNLTQNDSASAPHALVGADVPTEKAGKDRVFRFGGNNYVVVGELGRRDESLLSEVTVLLDNTLFERHHGEVVLDGKGITLKAVSRLGIAATPHAASTSHRTNIDLVSPVVIGLNTVLIGIGALVFGSLSAVFTIPRNRVTRVLGRTRRQTIALTAVETLFPLCAIGMAAAASIYLTATEASLAHLGSLLLLLVTAAASSLALHLRAASRKAHR